MTLDQAIHIVQVSFPQIYLACHTRHQRKRSTEHRLSQRDASILAHLDQESPMAPAKLATHLGIARSTLSEALKRLIALGYAGNATPGRRTSRVILTAKGARAIRETSVLETNRLRTAMKDLSRGNLSLVADGMETLAAVCREMGHGYQPRRTA
jgi:MarR family transcriptional regulator, organic hydroperoxide resistance regulator